MDNKYSYFFNNLKYFLIKNNLQKKTEFDSVTEDEIYNILPNIPLAYKEWLKVFGNIDFLLNFYIESYTIKALQEAQKDNEVIKFINKQKLIPISIFQNYLHTYLMEEEENPTIYQYSPESGEFINQSKFTTHIKEVLIHLINSLKQNDKTCKTLAWFNKDIINTSFESKVEYKNFIKKIEIVEENQNRIIPISEVIIMWNNINQNTNKSNYF